jgi:tetratricopeptide (TPR) repeat protein
MLAALQLAEFIYEQPALSDIEYTFKHALTQEVAYDSILVERRKQIHELAARAIEALFVANLSDHYNGLAHHYVRSGNVPKAVNYLHLAAQQAMARSAYAEANAQLTAALELLQSQPENLERDRTEITVRLNLAFCLGTGPSESSVEETASILQPALQLCERVGDYASRLRVLEVLGFIYGLLLEHQNEARAINEELLLVGERLHDPDVAGDARFYLGYASLYQGRLLAAKEEFDHACRLSADASSARMRPMNWRIQTRFLSSVVLWALGYPELASTGSKEAFAELHAGGPPLDIIVATFYSATLKLLMGDPSTAYAENEKAVRLSIEYDLRTLVPWCVALRGWTLVQMGQVESGLSEILRYKTEVIQTREVFIHWLFVWLAGAYLASSQTSEGLQTINEGLELSQRTGTRMLEAELRRLKGELLLMGDRGAAEEAAQCFRDAIAVARSQSAKSWELRATMSLARLLAKQDRRDEARAMLAEIYGWFTEGFDTADLKDAKAMLDDLAG